MVGKFPIKLHDETLVCVINAAHNIKRCSEKPCSPRTRLGDVHELRVQLRDDILHRGMMGELSDQRLLDLHLDAHQLQKGEQGTLKAEKVTALGFFFL